jgi:hypothetical protein
MAASTGLSLRRRAMTPMLVASMACESFISISYRTWRAGIRHSGKRSVTCYALRLADELLALPIRGLAVRIKRQPTPMMAAIPT